MGFASYPEYLKSSLWKKIRSRVIKENNRTCVQCGKRATQVHHTNYSLACLDGHDDSGLLSTCRNCHQNAEFDGDGKKRTLSQANKHLRGKSTQTTTPRKKRSRPNQSRKKKQKKRKDAQYRTRMVLCPICQKVLPPHGPCGRCEAAKDNKRQNIAAQFTPERRRLIAKKRSQSLQRYALDKRKRDAEGIVVGQGK